MDIRDASGNIVFRVAGDKIYNMQGQWVYEKEDNYVYDATGALRYEIRGNRIYDTRGAWVLEIADTPRPQAPSQNSAYPARDVSPYASRPPAHGGYNQPLINPQQNVPYHPERHPPSPGVYHNQPNPRQVSPYPPHPFVPGVYNQQPPNPNGKGNLLIAGSGGEYLRSVIGATIIIIIIGIGLVVGGFLLANAFGYRPVGGAIGAGIGTLIGAQVPQVRGVLWYVFAFGGILTAVGMIGWELIQCIYMSKTEIFVFEGGIKGVGLGPKYGLSAGDTTTATDFQLEYDRITSVDVIRGSYVIINAHGKEYLIGATNPQQIAEIASEKLRQAKLSYNQPPRYPQHW